MQLEIEQLRKVFDDGVVALHDICLQVEIGEFLVLVGPSGCGKSTLLRCIAGLEDISGGRVAVAGREVGRLPPQQRDIAMVFQKYALYPHMSVADNLAFPLKMAGMACGERQAKVQAVAEQLQLTPLLRRKPSMLSGGQQQRVAMGRALVREPQLFLMDEPLSNLDARLRAQMRAEIAALQQRLGVTTVYVTHDQVEALTLGHRICVLKHGRIQQLADGDTLYRHPANAFVASFIGSPSMHLFQAELCDGFLTWPGGRIACAGSGYPEGRPRVWGLRPEAVQLGESFQARVELVERLGHEALVYCTPPWPVHRAAGEEDLGSPHLMARLPGDQQPRLGECLGLRFDPADLYAFDEQGLSVPRGPALVRSGSDPRRS